MVQRPLLLANLYEVWERTAYARKSTRSPRKVKGIVYVRSSTNMAACTTIVKTAHTPTGRSAPTWPFAIGLEYSPLDRRQRKASPRLPPAGCSLPKVPLALAPRATVTARYMSAIQSGASMRVHQGPYAPGSSNILCRRIPL